MRRLCSILALFLLTAIPSLAQGQSPADSGRFVVFIHAGTKGIANPPPLVDKITAMLADRGYLVRAPDTARDEVGGAGVDYFYPTDLPAAQDIANVINQVVNPSTPLKPRYQRVKNPPGYIGVWLFGAPAS